MNDLCFLLLVRDVSISGMNRISKRFDVQNRYNPLEASLTLKFSNVQGFSFELWHLQDKMSHMETGIAAKQ